MAPRDVNPGSDYSDQIADALERSTVMVMIFSRWANQSRHVKNEIDRAFNLGRIIIPFRIEDIEPEKGLAYYLAKTHWLDAVTPPLERQIKRLAETITRLSGEESPPVLPTLLLHSVTRPPKFSLTRVIIVLIVCFASIAAVAGFLLIRWFDKDSEAPAGLSTAPSKVVENNLPVAQHVSPRDAAASPEEKDKPIVTGSPEMQAVLEKAKGTEPQLNASVETLQAQDDKFKRTLATGTAYSGGSQGYAFFDSGWRPLGMQVVAFNSNNETLKLRFTSGDRQQLFRDYEGSVTIDRKMMRVHAKLSPRDRAVVAENSRESMLFSRDCNVELDFEANGKVRGTYCGGPSTIALSRDQP